jgi:hypothetical protein
MRLSHQEGYFFSHRGTEFTESLKRQGVSPEFFAFVREKNPTEKEMYRASYEK